MLIDCDHCVGQYTEACRDCVVTHLLHGQAGQIEVGERQAEALEVLAEYGLVPRLRLHRRAAND
jgi:hypothetical protein